MKCRYRLMETPCINVCSLDPVDGLCIGCHRTIGEIMDWSRYTGSERQRIMDDLPRRADGRNLDAIEETCNA